MPENAWYQEIIDIQKDINAREAAQALNSADWAANFENRFNNRANWFPIPETELTNQRADGLPSTWDGKTWNQRFDWFPLPDVDKKAEKFEIWSDVSASLNTFWAKLENSKIYLANGKVLEPDSNVAKISVENYAQAKMLDWPASMTLRVDNKDQTFQLLHFSTWANWNKLTLEQNWVQAIWYNIPRNS